MKLLQAYTTSDGPMLIGLLDDRYCFQTYKHVDVPLSVVDWKEKDLIAEINLWFDTRAEAQSYFDEYKEHVANHYTLFVPNCQDGPF